jgi:hypothetical protein
VLGNFGSIITGIESAINLVGDAFRFASDTIAPFINSAVESQDAIAELEAVLKATEGAAGLTSQELQDMANELQNVTRFGDETIMSGQSMLLTFRNIGEDTFPRATEAMLDMAEMFGSVDTAAVQLGKALNDPIAGIGALQRIGIQFTDEQKEMIENFMAIGDVASAQNIILKEVEMQIGGLAVAMGETFAGKVEILKNRFDEIRETIGSALLPILSDLATVVMDNMPAIERFGGAIADWLTELRESGVIQEFAEKVAILFDKVIGLATAFVDAGVNSSEFREALGYLFEGVEISPESVIGFLDRLDASMAGAVGEHNWTASGAAFGRMLDSFMGGGLGADSQDSQFIPAITDALNRWLLAAVGAVSWEQWADAAGENITNALRDFFRFGAIQDAWQQIGEDIAAGLSAGISWENMRSNITTFINNVINYFKQLLGIASPSTVFMQIGQDIVRGLINGITSMFSSLSTAVGNMFDILTGGDGTGGATGTFGGFGDTGTIGGRIMDRTTTGGGVLAGGTVTNIYNFYAPVYMSGVGPEGTYDCAPSPLISSGANPFPSGYR